MSGTVWADLPKITQIRLAAIAVLHAAPALAGVDVRDTPLQDLQDGDLPAIGVFADQKRDPRSQAGTDPQFDVNCTLRLQVSVGYADPTDAVATCDILAQATLDALLGDGIFLGMTGPIGAIDTTYNRGTAGELFRVQAMHAISLRWFESYPTQTPTALQPGGQPLGIAYQTRPALSPLTGAVVTTAEPAGTTPMIADTTLPQ